MYLCIQLLSGKCTAFIPPQKWHFFCENFSERVKSSEMYVNVIYVFGKYIAH